MSTRIETIEALEALYDAPAPTTLQKDVARINPEYRRLIEASPFAGVATIGPGGMDCSPRGDGPGFARILNETIKGLQKKDGPWVDWNTLSDDEKKVLKEYGSGTRPSLRQNRIFH